MKAKHEESPEEALHKIWILNYLLCILCICVKIWKLKFFIRSLRISYIYLVNLIFCRESIWGILAGLCSDIPPIIKHDVKQIETWILRLLSAPVPVPGKTRVEMEILDSDSHPPFVFALPDHTRFSLADFPLHLPLELLGIDTCLKVLTLIIMENKVKYNFLFFK